MKKLLSICLLLALSLSLFAGCETLPPVEENTSITTTSTTTATTTNDPTPTPPSRDDLTKPDLSDLQKELYHAVWERVKDGLDETITINRLDLGNFAFKLRDIYICIPRNTDGGLYEYPYDPSFINVEGYSFEYDVIQPEAFIDGKFYKLQDAVDAGLLSSDDIRIIWEAYTDSGSMESKTLINDRILMDSLFSKGFVPYDAEKDRVAKLFDGIQPTDPKGQLSGTVSRNACFFFETDEPVQLTVYSTVNGSEIESPNFNLPIATALFATNDAQAVANLRDNSDHVTNYHYFLEDEGWVMLSYAEIESMSDQNHGQTVHAIAPYVRGEYQYYCWLVEYMGYPEERFKAMQFAELELYTD